MDYSSMSRTKTNLLIRTTSVCSCKETLLPFKKYVFKTSYILHIICLILSSFIVQLNTWPRSNIKHIAIIYHSYKCSYLFHFIKLHKHAWLTIKFYKMIDLRITNIMIYFTWVLNTKCIRQVSLIRLFQEYLLKL